MTHGRETIPVRLFLDTIRNWLAAVDRADSTSACYYAAEINKTGRLLAVDPEFKRIFARRKIQCKTEDAERAVDCVCEFFHAVSDAGLDGTYRKKT